MARIGVDLDGVVADFNTGFIDVIWQLFKIRLPKPSSTYPHVWNYHLEGGVTKEQDKELWGFIAGSPYFWGELKPLPNARMDLAYLYNLRMQGHEIIFITARRGLCVKLQSELWLESNGFEGATVLIEHDKGPLINALKLDMFVDDRPENITECQQFAPKTKRYLFDAPYNQSYPLIDGTKRVSTVKEALNDYFGPKWQAPTL